MKWYNIANNRIVEYIIIFELKSESVTIKMGKNINLELKTIIQDEVYLSMLYMLVP